VKSEWRQRNEQRNEAEVAQKSPSQAKWFPTRAHFEVEVGREHSQTDCGRHGETHYSALLASRQGFLSYLIGRVPTQAVGPGDSKAAVLAVLLSSSRPAGAKESEMECTKEGDDRSDGFESATGRTLSIIMKLSEISSGARDGVPPGLHLSVLPSWLWGLPEHVLGYFPPQPQFFHRINKQVEFFLLLFRWLDITRLAQ